MVAARTQEAQMMRKIGWMILLALAGCSGVSTAPTSSTSCAGNPGNYACQVEMYNKAGF
jgi:hypothetical protein